MIGEGRTPTFILKIRIEFFCEVSRIAEWIIFSLFHVIDNQLRELFNSTLVFFLGLLPSPLPREHNTSSIIFVVHVFPVRVGTKPNSCSVTPEFYHKPRMATIKAIFAMCFYSQIIVFIFTFFIGIIKHFHN